MLRVCDVCLEPAGGGGGTGGGAVRLGACGHVLCGGCADAWAASAAARCLHSGAPLRCVLPRCGRAVPLHQAQRLLERAGVADAEAGAAFEAAALIPEEAQFICPYPDCGAMSELEAALPDAPSACPACGRWVCPYCRCMWHAGQRCAQYQAHAGGATMGASAAAAAAAGERRCRVFWRRASAARTQQQQQPALFRGHSPQQQQQQLQQQQQQRDQNGPALFGGGGGGDGGGGSGGCSTPMSP